MSMLLRTIRKISNFTNIKSSDSFVGRWSVPNSIDLDKNINLIIDRNNNDHCGTCHVSSSPSSAPPPSFSKIKTQLEDVNDDKYYLPYIM